MLKPAMNKHSFAILLLLLSLLVSSPADARLTLGIVSGTLDSSGEVSSARANSLAALLTERLQEEVVVKELSDVASLVNGLDAVAMLDLALLSSKVVEANPGRFLSVGKIDPAGDLLLISRQGVSGAWLQRAAEVLRQPEFSGEQALTKNLPGEVAVVESEPPTGLPTLPETITLQEQRTIEEAELFAALTPEIRDSESVASAQELSRKDALNAEILALLGADAVASVVSQPDIPQEFRPTGVPVVRIPSSSRRPVAEEDALIVASMPEPLKQTIPDSPPQLLPIPEPEPGVIYVVPFVAIMVPKQVNDRFFDEFVDLLNQGGQEFGVQFVILKEGLQRVAPDWLAIRKYITGEIYAYVEDSSCCATELRSRARLTYHRPGQEVPEFDYEYPVKSFFDHDSSTIEVERVKVAEDIAAKLSGELLKTLRN